MALAYSSDKITNKQYLPSASPHSAREVYGVTTTVAVGDPLIDNNLVGLAILPPDCIPTDLSMVCEELSDGTDIVFDVGILNSGGDDLVPNSLLVTGSTAAQNNGGVQNVNSPQAIYAPATWLAEATCPAISVEKTIAMKVTTPATTEKAGSLYSKFEYRAAENGV